MARPPWRWQAIAAGLLLALASCTSHPPAERPVAVQPEASCLASLGSLGVAYREVSPPAAPHPCGIADPVSVTAAPEPFARPVLMGCALAAQVARWQAESVVPEARRYLGQNITGAIQPLAGYACRQEIGSKRNYVSQHGYGRALDIGGWRLGDGSVVSVARDWHDSGPKGRFLHAVALEGCHYFSVVLTPDVNTAHRNHFHVDIGDYRFCAPTQRYSPPDITVISPSSSPRT